MSLQDHSIAPYRTDPAWLITASSFLADRIVPECERIHLPVRTTAGGTLRYGHAPLPAPASPPRRLLRRAPAPIEAPHRNVFDLRRNAPDNWAHFLNNHLPIVLTICDRLALDPAQVLLVLPAATPAYITGAADLLGLEVLTTDAPLSGTGIAYDATPWTGIRPERHLWVRHPHLDKALARIESAADDTPARVFLSRRTTRAPENEAEIMAWLGPRGFHKVYPEDLTPAQQIRLFRRAEAMVAIHGAGLAPLLFMGGGGRLRALVEILHAGHMTDVYRVMAHQVGVDWIGVRGRLKPEYIRGVHDTDAGPYKAHSLDTFEVDTEALALAFEEIGLA